MPIMVILFKKGNTKYIKNYRHICLLSNMYKLFAKIITTRLEKKLDENQPREQAGFRSKYSTTDHIHAINQLKEKCREYNIPLCVAFVDYEKAFDSMQTQTILTYLHELGIEDAYLEILKDIYTDSSVTVHLHKSLRNSGSREVYDRGTPSHPSCSRQDWRVYSEG